MLSDLCIENRESQCTLSTLASSTALPPLQRSTCPSTFKSPDACIVTHAHFSILQASRNVERATSFSRSCSSNLCFTPWVDSSWFLLERFQNRSFFHRPHPPQSCQQHKSSSSASASGCAFVPPVSDCPAHFIAQNGCRGIARSHCRDSGSRHRCSSSCRTRPEGRKHPAPEHLRATS
jgi:hypothetical protein